MVTMFIVGVLLALGFGITSGILYAQHQRSVFTRKFAEQLQKLAKEYEAQIVKMQEQDRQVVQTLQETLQKTLSGQIPPEGDVPPPRGRFN